jgi:hypothetical protein
MKRMADLVNIVWHFSVTNHPVRLSYVWTLWGLIPVPR